MAKVVAILETMYDGRGGGDSARFFRINPHNHSGRRLYNLIGDQHTLLVTNACRAMGRTSNCHSTPDPSWLFDNLMLLREKPGIDLLLVCGKVAQRTFAASGFALPPGTTHIEMLHPAARTWTAAMIADLKAQIAKRLQPTGVPA